MYTNIKRANCPGETLLANALDADANANFEVAFDFYQRGITYYLQVRMVNETNSSIQACIRQTCHEHLKRAEIIKLYMETRQTANLHLTNAENAYKQLDYPLSYPLFIQGIESLLESAQIIKSSHPQLSNAILRSAATHMAHAEEVNKILNSTTSPQIATAVLVSSDADNENSSYSSANTLELHECNVESPNIIEPEKFRHSMGDVGQRAPKQTDETHPTEEEKKIRALLYRQRIDALNTESHLLLNYLNLDTENEDKLKEMEHVITEISNFLEETDESGQLVVGEHSSDRETLDTSLQLCLDFLASPRSSSIVDKEEASLREREWDEEREREMVRRPECLVCCDDVAVMATVPCGHKILCQQCVIGIGDKLKTCYVCKTELLEPKCIRIFD